MSSTRAPWANGVEQVATLAHRFRAAGIPGLVLAVEGALEDADRERLAVVSLLVHRSDFRAAQRAIRATPWRYELGGVGAWSLRRSVLFTYDSAIPVALHGKLPLGLLPARTLHALEEELWSDPAVTAPGLRHPPLAALAVYLAVQCGRPDRAYHRTDWAQFQRLVELDRDLRSATRLAAGLGVAGALDRARRAVSDGEHPSAESPFDRGVRHHAWRAARRVRRALAGRPLGRLIAGELGLGELPGRARFGGIELVSRPPVFPPTPPTERFLPLAAAHLARRPGRPAVVVDVGTGCGSVALALAVGRPDTEVHATDVSRQALRAARRNARTVGVRVHFHHGSLLDPLPDTVRGRVDVLLANLPYYPHGRYVPSGAVARAAIEGPDADGLGYYRRLVEGLPRILRPGGLAVVQMFDWQWARLTGELGEGLQPLPSVDDERFVVGALVWRPDAAHPSPADLMGGRP